MSFMGKPYGKLECYYILGMREGIVVPEEGRFMGKGLNFCLDIFDYQEYSKEEIVKKCRITPAILEKNAEYERLKLSKGDSFVIAAAADAYRILTGEGSEICIVYPGADMESR